MPVRHRASGPLLPRPAASPGCLLLRPGPDFPRRLRAAAEGADARGHLIFDAQIAALCEAYGVGAILTADRDLLRFPSLEVRLLGAADSTSP